MVILKIPSMSVEVERLNWYVPQSRSCVRVIIWHPPNSSCSMEHETWDVNSLNLIIYGCRYKIVHKFPKHSEGASVGLSFLILEGSDLYHLWRWTILKLLTKRVIWKRCQLFSSTLTKYFILLWWRAVKVKDMEHTKQRATQTRKPRYRLQC